MFVTFIESGAVFFQFESDFVATLRCIPMIVRFKLDLCGVKLSLKAWSRFDHDLTTLFALSNLWMVRKKLMGMGKLRLG